jgi:hypothetical protein
VPGKVINPLTDDMNTTRPRASRSWGSTAWTTPIWAVTLTSSWRARSSSDKPVNGALHDDAGVVDHPVERGREMLVQARNGRPIGDVQLDGMHVGHPAKISEVSG